LFNLNIARQLAEFEIDRKKLTRVEDQPAEGWVSWAGSWFGGKSAAATEQTGIIEKFEAAIDDEEKNKLYEAIGYQVKILDRYIINCEHVN
jgi:hypothetical protein